MKKFLLFIFMIFVISCSKELTDHQKFMESVREYCGHAYPGITTTATISPFYFFLNEELSMHIPRCKKNEIKVPLHAGGASLHTWTLRLRDDGLQLSHTQIKSPDSDEETGLYRGYADDEGNKWIQFFPVTTDNDTFWAIEIDPDMKTYSHRYYVENELRFESVFDLSSPMSLD